MKENKKNHIDNSCRNRVDIQIRTRSAVIKNQNSTRTMISLSSSGAELFLFRKKRAPCKRRGYAVIKTPCLFGNELAPTTVL